MDERRTSEETISRQRYLVASFNLPNYEGKDRIVVNDIRFTWNAKLKGWMCMHPIISEPANGKIDLFCRVKCMEKVEHIMNVEGTKVKCSKCGNISPIKL